VVLLVGLGSTAHATDKSEAPPSEKQIAQWIRRLDDDSFKVRESASKHLLQSGKAAISAVAAAAIGDSLEVTERALRILDELASSTDVSTARAAKEALTKLAASKHSAAAVRARTALRSYQQRVVGTLERCGARVQTTGDRIVSVNFDAAKVLGENLRLLHELPDVEHLSFETPLMDDDGLAALKGLPQLRDLNLYRSRVGDAGLKYLKTLPSLRRVPMGETRVTDKGLVHLKDLTQLEYVGLRGDRVTDAGLVHLKDLTNLTGLYLGETKVTDAGLVHLRRLTKLNWLLLHHTQVSDAGLEHLKELTALRDLDLSATRVTEAGMARLKKALPQVQIYMKQP
jgi:hypothetical protein